jgi:DNA-binding MarR family transcriptional regulator
MTAGAGAVADDRLSATLQHHRQMACQVQRLDDALGLHHGLSWNELLLLDALHAAGGRLPAREAAAATGRSPAGLLRQVLPMEKIGLVQRARDGAGPPHLQLAAGGARRLREACDTARSLLEDEALAAPDAPPPGGR